MKKNNLTRVLSRDLKKEKLTAGGFGFIFSLLAMIIAMFVSSRLEN